jgi:hypothetical protein
MVHKWMRKAQIDAGARAGSRPKSRRAKAFALRERRIVKGQWDFEDRFNRESSRCALRDEELKRTHQADPRRQLRC